MKLSVSEFSPARAKAPAILSLGGPQAKTVPSLEIVLKAPAIRRETKSLFAHQSLAREQTEFWEDTIFIALAVSGLATVVIALLAAQH
jgi:hypothetical protein